MAFLLFWHHLWTERWAHSLPGHEGEVVRDSWLMVRIPRNFGPPTDDEPFRYEFAAPLGT